MLVLKNFGPEHAEQLEALQRKVFPSLSPDEIMTRAHYLKHLEIFPEGQFAVFDGDRLVAATTTMRSRRHEGHHTFLEASGNLWMTTHDPSGEWLYGLDMGVDPEYRGRGLARMMYRARHELVRRLGLKGQMIVGMLNGFEPYAGKLSVRDYFERVCHGELNDPTISAQMKMGFEIVELVEDYLDDPACGNAGALMILPAEKDV